MRKLTFIFGCLLSLYASAQTPAQTLDRAIPPTQPSPPFMHLNTLKPMLATAIVKNGTKNLQVITESGWASSWTNGNYLAWDDYQGNISFANYSGDFVPEDVALIHYNGFLGSQIVCIAAGRRLILPNPGFDYAIYIGVWNGTAFVLQSSPIIIDSPPTPVAFSDYSDDIVRIEDDGVEKFAVVYSKAGTIQMVKGVVDLLSPNLVNLSSPFTVFPNADFPTGTFSRPDVAIKEDIGSWGGTNMYVAADYVGSSVSGVVVSEMDYIPATTTPSHLVYGNVPETAPRIAQYYSGGDIAVVFRESNGDIIAANGTSSIVIGSYFLGTCSAPYASPGPDIVSSHNGFFVAWTAFDCNNVFVDPGSYPQPGYRIVVAQKLNKDCTFDPNDFYLVPYFTGLDYSTFTSPVGVVKNILPFGIHREEVCVAFNRHISDVNTFDPTRYYKQTTLNNNAVRSNFDSLRKVSVKDIVFKKSYNPAKQRQRSLLLYPNPATSYLIISDQKLLNTPGTSYTIYSMDGKLIRSGNLSRNRLDISYLKAGSYYLRVMNKETSLSSPFIKL